MSYYKEQFLEVLKMFNGEETPEKIEKALAKITEVDAEITLEYLDSFGISVDRLEKTGFVTFIQTYKDIPSSDDVFSLNIAFFKDETPVCLGLDIDLHAFDFQHIFFMAFFVVRILNRAQLVNEYIDMLCDTLNHFFDENQLPLMLIPQKLHMDWQKASEGFFGPTDN